MMVWRERERRGRKRRMGRRRGAEWKRGVQKKEKEDEEGERRGEGGGGKVEEKEGTELNVTQMEGALTLFCPLGLCDFWWVALSFCVFVFLPIGKGWAIEGGNFFLTHLGQEILSSCELLWRNLPHRGTRLLRFGYLETDTERRVMGQWSLQKVLPGRC